MIRRPLVCGRSVRVAGDPEDLYFTALRDGEEVTDDVLALFEHLVPRNAAVIDVGANIGITTLALSALAPEGEVFAFEPVPETLKWLDTNLRENGATNVVVHRAAVGSEVGEIVLWRNGEFLAGSMVVDHAADMMRSRVGEESWAFVTAPCTTIDSFVAERNLAGLDLLKIDTEGHDLHVLRGAKQTLIDLRPAVLTEFATFPLTMHEQLFPADALTEIRELFDRVFIVDPKAKLREIVTDGDAVDMLYENATSKPVHDLLCLYDGHPLLDRLDDFRGEPPDPQARERELAELRGQVEALQAQLDAMRHTVSWRMTRPLRAVRRLTRRSV